VHQLDSGSAMLSRDFPSASIPSTNSVAAASRSNAAANAYPALTLQADPDSMSQPNRSGEVLPPIADAKRVETRNRQGARLKRKNLACGQISRTRRGRGKKEDRKPCDRLCDRSEISRRKKICRK
jgi:hypothetical protein